MQYPDECIIHDGFPFLERRFKYEGAEHYGNTEFLEHNEFNETLFKELVTYIDNYDFKTPFEKGLFNPYFRKPHLIDFYKEVDKMF